MLHFLTLPAKEKPSSLTGRRREKQECASVDSGAKKCYYPDALAGDPMGFSTTSDPSLPEVAQGWLMPPVDLFAGPPLWALLTHVPRLSRDLPSFSPPHHLLNLLQSSLPSERTTIP